uniref:Transmembrane protein 126A n=2 Tax=Bos mutus grunniens TaxID=30521 RepID=A0A8B9YLA4_BOSMU
MENHEPDGTIIKENLTDIIARKINQLPEAERNLLENGSTYVGLNAALCGLIANSLFRRILHVTQARIAAGLPMAVIPFLTANVSYKGFVSLPLNTGDLQCETCTVTRGGLVGLVFGGLYPVFLAIPVNGGLAARYNSALLPEKGNILNYWIRISKPVFRKMLFPILLQTGFAAYLGSRQYKLLIKALQLPEPGLPMAVIPFLTANVSYKGFVSLPLNTGDLQCETCTVTRGGLVGLVFGGLYPVFLAIPVNGGLAARYNSALLPEKGNILNYWIRISKPVFRKMLFPILLQTGFAAYLGSRQYKLLIKALQLPEPGLEIE